MTKVNLHAPVTDEGSIINLDREILAQLNPTGWLVLTVTMTPPPVGWYYLGELVADGVGVARAQGIVVGLVEGAVQVQFAFHYRIPTGPQLYGLRYLATDGTEIRSTRAHSVRCQCRICKQMTEAVRANRGTTVKAPTDS